MEQELVEKWKSSKSIREMCRLVNIPIRKQKLFGVACCRCLTKYIIDIRLLNFIDVVESDADGLVSNGIVHFARKEAEEAAAVIDDVPNPEEYEGIYNSSNVAHTVLAIGTTFIDENYCAEIANGYAFSLIDGRHVTPEKEMIQKWDQYNLRACDLFKNIVNPFKELTFVPSEQVVKLAELIYQEKDWESLLVLSDMLEDEGCTDVELVNHLRQPKPCRGWWSLDLITEISRGMQ